MSDQSKLDQRYFIDETIYNCPFCNRRHVSYLIYDYAKFDWTENKKCYAYFAICNSCGHQSMHLTFDNVPLEKLIHHGLTRYKFQIDDGVDAGELLDRVFFYSVPTSFFVIDERIPRILRELLTEAEGCLKSNFLTGASACVRKSIYELAIQEKATGENYEDRIKSLKKVHSEVAPIFFDTLLTIQQITSQKVHENSYDGWESKHLKIILAAISDVIHEIYVVPALREDRRESILKLKNELIGSESLKAKSSDKTKI